MIEDYFNKENPSKCIFIIDINIFNKWNERIIKLISNFKYYLIESIEKNKTMETYNMIMNFLFENNINRDYTLFGIGGGIVGDISGFVASTFMRGIKLIHIPTTLLSMVDSSIGGKTGINNVYGKNMIGSIYQAHDIIIDITWLKTLPKEHIINGMAEVIKMALLKGGKLYNLVLDSDPITLKNLNEIIILSAKYKLEIIGDDMNDMKGMRELLNFGHTWGHAIEFSQNILHGFAVAEGILEEMKYTNYYYSFPTMSVIKTVYQLLKKWELINNNTKYELKMIEFYLSHDKKSNRLVSIEDIGKPKIVKFNINRWKFISYPSFFVKNNRIIKNKKFIILSLPGSKSVTNRALICSVLKSFNSNMTIRLDNSLISEDTELLICALKQTGVDISISDNSISISAINLKPTGTYYLGNSGTCVRFLLPLLAIITNEQIIIDGSDEMKKRPIQPLIDSLNSIGCDIISMNNDMMLPLSVNPCKMNNIDSITIDGTLSSQYVSGLIFAMSYLLKYNKHKSINIIGEETSKGFINLTIKMLEEFNFIINYDNNIINLIKYNNSNILEYNVEGDATALSYMIGWSYLTKQKILIDNINFSSNQSDIKIIIKVSKYFGNLFEVIKDNNKVIMFEPYYKIKNDQNNITIDLDSSDTFLTWGCLFAIENINFEITNILNQSWKECNRIENFKINIKMLGGKVEKTQTGFKILNGIDMTQLNSIDIPTYNDHRFAMSFSLLSILNSHFTINNPHCVSKTFPKYWEEIKKMGIDILPFISKSKNIILIGMPQSGKTTLAKLASEVLNIEWNDTDDMITSEHKCINTFIHEHGWEQFRNIEHEKLKKCLDNKSLKIISTGGGIVTNPLSRKLLETSIIIYIKGKYNDNIDRLLPDNYETIEIERKHIYENISDYVYENNDNPENFINWLKLIITNPVIPQKSFFLCKTNDVYENNFANLIELRGDLMVNYGLDVIQKVMKKFNKHIIYTLRSKKEGGMFEGNNESYNSLNKKAIKLGCKIIDLEINDFKINNLDLTNLTIGSIHSDDINYIKKKLEFFQESILKIVTTEENCNNLKYTLSFIKNKILIDNMNGRYRLTNNFLTPLASSLFEKTAINQLNQFDYIKKSFVENNTKFIFLFGNNIAHSPSSFIHNYVFCKENLNISYLNFETNDKNIIFELIKEPYFKGASITMPYKEIFNTNLLATNSLATNLLAINTVIKNDNIISYENTDIIAIKYFLKNNMTTILGTGGSAIASIEACILNKITNITIVGRNKQKLEFLNSKYNINICMFNDYNIILEEHNVICCLPPNVNITKYIDSNSNLIDMTYGIHNINKKQLIVKSYISGYDIMYIQAAYQYISWFNKKDNHKYIIDLYKKAIEDYKLLV